MANLEKVEELIKRFEKNYRGKNVEPILRGKIFSLNARDISNVKDSELFWPDKWPQSDSRGIYAICSEDRVLYIGKASLQSLGYRLGSYFEYSEDRKSGVPSKGSQWSTTPTHVFTWAVPDETFFEASSVEEFLINELKDELPDNTRGKN